MYTLQNYALIAKFAVVSLAFLAETTLMTTCKCTRTGLSISAETKQTSITAPPGGGARSFISIRGIRFAPNAPITISFRVYPSANSEFNEATVTDGAGNINWEKDLSELPARNFSSDPDVDVFIQAKETNSDCFSLTTIKTRMILNPPLK